MHDSAAPVPLERLLAHRAWVRRVARALVRDENEADDLEQDVWIEAMRRPPRAGQSILGWFAAVLRHDVVDRRRSEHARARRHELHIPAEAPRSPDDLVAEADAHRRVVDAVMALDEPYRSTVLWRYFEDLSPPQIAARQGVPLETVRTRLRRALVLLRERFGATADRAVGMDWRAALVPLTAGASLAPASVPATASGAGIVTGGLLMKASTKAVVAVVALLLFAGAWWAGAGSRGQRAAEPETATVPDEAPVPRERRARAASPSEERDPAPAAGSGATTTRAAPPQPAPTEPQTQPVAFAPPGTAVGRVLLLPDRSPVADAVVRLTGGFGGPDVDSTVPRIGSVTTGADGAFRIDGLTPGHYSFEVKSGDRVPRTFDAVIPPDGSGFATEVLFGEGGGIEGTVFAADGPAAGVAVKISKGVLRHACKTDDGGRYRIEGLPAGFWNVEVSGGAAGERSSGADVGVGRMTRIDFQGGASIVGVVTKDGAPLDRATVRIVGTDEPSRFQSARTASDGSYRITVVPEGTWRVWVQAWSDSGSVVVAEARVVPGENRLDVRFGEGDLAGAIEGRAFAATSGAPIDPDWGGQAELYEQIEKAPGAWVQGALAAVAWPDAQGVFRIAGLRAGRYRLIVRATRRGPARPALTQVATDVELRPGERRAGLEIALHEAARREERESAAFLTGTVFDESGRVLSSANVSAHPEGAGSSRQARSNDSGQYRIDRLEPGTWRVQIQVIGEGGFSTDVADVAIVRGVNRLDLRLGGERTCELAGRVVSMPSGRALSWQDVALQLWTQPESGLPRAVAYAQASAGGRFRFRALQAGRFRLVATPQKGALKPREMDVELAAGATQPDLEVALEELVGGTLVLVVTDTAGRPVRRVSVAEDSGDGRAWSVMLDSPTGVYDRAFEAGVHVLRVTSPDASLTGEATATVAVNGTTRVDVVLRPRKTE